MTDNRKASWQAQARQEAPAEDTAHVRATAADPQTTWRIPDVLNPCYPRVGQATSYPTRDSTGTRTYLTVDTRQDGRADG